MSFLHFISLNAEWILAIRLQFPQAQSTCGDIQTLSRQNTVFISPANCVGYMDSGINFVYNQYIFPCIETVVLQTIQSLGIHTFLGRSYLPIGSAVLVPYEESALISTPTMVLPIDLNTTQNAYHSFLAALLLFEKYRRSNPQYQTLVVPSLCCGYGKMQEKESADQMKRAYQDFLEGNVPEYMNTGDTSLVTPAMPEHCDTYTEDAQQQYDMPYT
jgi:O-acetyl-ADP-ribose deacetylase (regulator of RNase III)